ncbi:MAG: RnfABCDGE type electron transport complex subunit A [Bacteroidales bacterium]|jgi:electron transport complex protein RnfA|nr:RnfABCDGE type electron transport complex subunit A [Bacteroidales bacterium]MBP5370668.1 RnfABCDGE type electron transport complex subunit A [Bacteroidales bacterium]MBP5724046.1 RnfABCDGE type electron transport complex subunit A [Bacteroidales bacterium]MBQ3677592.1 RnfABCDGE type electron transport complex subunit A [Bacteroidales bacterium]MBR3981461.1 RnfABCDGE type electron transport complex subunit A [Bacteroidales bacterium]
MAYVLIIISAVFVNNIVLSQFLGICPFLGVSKRVNTALGMSGAVMFVMVLATLVTYLLNQYVLVPLELEFLQTISFILIIASLVQMVEIVLKKVSHSLYEALGVFLPLITTNCCVLGVSIMALDLPSKFNFVEANSLGLAVVFALANSLAFGLALVLFAGIREQLEITETPRKLQGTPISLISAGLLALAFMGFSGLV